jgi:undecaprenyl-diphosphatase
MNSRKYSGSRMACLAVSSLVFASLVVSVISGASDELDAAVRSAVKGWASPLLTAFFMFVTQLGSVAVVYSLAVIETATLLWLGRKRDALYLAAVMAAAAVVNNAIKFAVARARPEAFFGELPSSYSFASGHALYSGCIYGVLGSIIAAEMPKTWQRALVLAGTLVLIAVIGFSRVYLGVHYPTDVLAGFALAALIICVARRFMGESAPA